MPAGFSIDPARGEIWDVDLDPTEGMEIQKERPCLILTVESFRPLAIRSVVPITGWQSAFEGKATFVPIAPGAVSGLTKPSAASALQHRSVSLERFTRRRGRVTADELEAVTLAVGRIIGHS